MLVYNKLENALQLKKLIEIYTTEEVYIGHILNLDKDFVLIESIDLHGTINGYFILRVSTIKNIKRDTKLIKRVNIYSEAAKELGIYNSQLVGFHIDDKLLNRNVDLLDKLLENSLLNKTLVRINTKNGSRRYSQIKLLDKDYIGISPLLENYTIEGKIHKQLKSEIVLLEISSVFISIINHILNKKGKY